MQILLIGVGGLLGGFLLILLLSFAKPQHAGSSLEPGEDAPHAWIARLDATDLGRLLSMLFAELKFDIDDSRVSGSVVDVFANNPTPITGGRVYIRGVAHPPLGVVGEEEVRIALETARAEMVGKALVATGGVFSPEAKSSAAGAPLELIDGAALMALIKKHLPPVAVARHV